MPQAAAKSKRTGAKPKKDREQKKREDKALDKALEESFPGSDPVSITQPAPTQPDQQPESGDHAGAGEPGRNEKQPA